MREFFDQERPLSPALVKQTVSIFGLLLLVFAAIIVLSGLGTLFHGKLLGGLTQILGGISLLFFLYIAARLLAEILMALHRMNDQMTILGDDLRTVRSAPKSAPKED